MVHTKLSVCMLALLTVGGATASAATYHVSQRAAGADDANTGTVDKPLKTLAALQARLKPGDTAIVHAGLYREKLVMDTAGTREKPIALRAAPGESVIVTGADRVQGWQREAAPAGGAPRAVWIKDGWTHRNAVQSPHQPGDEERARWDPSQVFVDGIYCAQVMRRDDMEPGTFYLDTTANRLYLWMPPVPGADKREGISTVDWWSGPVNLASEDPNDHMVEVSVRNVCLKIGDHTVLDGFHVRYCAANALNGAIYGKGDGFTIENCVAEWSNGGGIFPSGSNWVVRNCTARYNGYIGGDAHGYANCLFENNTMARNNYKGFDTHWSGGGFKICNSRGVTVRNCRFVENNGVGLWFDINCTGNILERNLVVGNYGGGIMMEVTHGNSLAPPSSDPNPNIIRNNICAYTRYDGTYGSGIMLMQARNNEVYNNTCVGNDQFGVFLRFHPYLYGPDRMAQRLSDNSVFNNLCSDNAMGPIFIMPPPLKQSELVTNNVSDFNLFYDAVTVDNIDRFSGRPFARTSSKNQRWAKVAIGGTFSTEELFLMWGQEEHSIQANPLFVSPRSMDFSVVSGSPAIGNGKKLPGLKDDFFGQPRPVKDRPTIGAVEYWNKEIP